MSRSRSIRNKRVRRRENRRLKFGSSAVPKHKRKGGRTGASMRNKGAPHAR